MSHEHEHEEHEHEHHGHDHRGGHHGHGHHGHGHHRHGSGRLHHALRRHLRRHGDDVRALEELQRDLEQAAADVAARINELRATASSGPAPTEQS